MAVGFVPIHLEKVVLKPLVKVSLFLKFGLGLCELGLSSLKGRFEFAMKDLRVRRTG